MTSGPSAFATGSFCNCGGSCCCASAIPVKAKEMASACKAVESLFIHSSAYIYYGEDRLLPRSRPDVRRSVQLGDGGVACQIAEDCVARLAGARGIIMEEKPHHV